MAQLVRLNEICERRNELNKAASSLDESLATPLGDLQRWSSNVKESLEAMIKKIAVDAEELESDEGLLNSIQDSFPYLSRRVLQHKVDHERLRRSVSALYESLVENSGIELISDALLIRTQVVKFLGQLSLYNQRDADLIYDAYKVDITEFKAFSPSREVAKL